MTVTCLSCDEHQQTQFQALEFIRNIAQKQDNDIWPTIADVANDALNGNTNTIDSLRAPDSEKFADSVTRMGTPCNHSHWSNHHCANMACWNYISNCPLHAIVVTGHICSLVERGIVI